MSEGLWLEVCVCRPVSVCLEVCVWRPVSGALEACVCGPVCGSGNVMLPGTSLWDSESGALRGVEVTVWDNAIQLESLSVSSRPKSILKQKVLQLEHVQVCVCAGLSHFVCVFVHVCVCVCVCAC